MCKAIKMDQKSFPQLAPPPPIPPRSRTYPSQPQVGWNISGQTDWSMSNATAPDYAPNFGHRPRYSASESGTQGISTNFGQGGFRHSTTSVPSCPLQSDTNGRNFGVSGASSIKEPLGRTNSNPSKPCPIIRPETTVASHHLSLISLSPDAQSTSVSNFHNLAEPAQSIHMDLKGLDFSQIPAGDELGASGGVDREDNSTKKDYSSIRHAFREVQGHQQITGLPVLDGQSSHKQMSNPVTSIGWNSSLFSSDPWIPMPMGNADSGTNVLGACTNNGEHNFTKPVTPVFNAWDSTGPSFTSADCSGFQAKPKNTKLDQASGNTLGPSSQWQTFLDPNVGLTRKTSSSDFDELRSNQQSEPVPGPFDDPFFFNNMEAQSSDQETRSRKNSDLIEFSSPFEEREMEYMSLTFFDPLYERRRKESISTMDGARSDVPSYAIASMGECEETNSAISSSKYYEKDSAIVVEDKNVYSENEKTKNDQKGSLYPTTELQMARDYIADDDALESFLRSTALPEESVQHDEPPPRPPPPSKTASYERLRQRMFVDEDSDAFCQMVAELKTLYKSTDERTNLGFIVSPLCTKQHGVLSVKIVIDTDFAADSILFTCDVHALVEHVVSNVLYSHLQDMSQSLSTADFILKVHDRSEYLLNHYPLSKYEYIHDCLKLDRDIRFVLMRRQDVLLPFLRTKDDDSQCLFFPKDYIKTDEAVVTRSQLEILMDTFYRQVEKLRDHILKNETTEVQIRGLKQAVKAICMTLAKIETIDIKKTLQRAEGIVAQFVSQENLQNLVNEMERGYRTDKEDTQLAINMAIRCSLIEELEEVLDQLLTTVKQLVRMYCKTFHTDYLLGSAVAPYRERKDVTMLEDNFILHIATVHRIPVTWSQMYDEFKIICSLHYGKDKIDKDVLTSCKKITTSSLCGLECIVWDEWVSFDEVPLQILPRETRVCLTLCGLKNMPNSSNTSNNPALAKIISPVGGVTVQLYNQKGQLINGSQLVPLKMYSVADPFTPICAALQSDSALLQINLPDFGKQIMFPEVFPAVVRESKSFDLLLPEIQDIVKGTLEKDCISSCQADELGILWQYRDYLHDYPDLLPWILQGVNKWDYRILPEIYTLLRDWGSINPMQALELLLPQYSDSKVRRFAVDCLKQMPSDDLLEFIPQLIQALKYESYHASDLSRLLLEQSCKSIRFAHKFFWLLKGAAQDSTFKHRYELMFVALVSVAGDALYQQLRKQEDFVKILTTAAEKVQVSRDKDNVLKRELQSLYEMFEEKGSVLLPYNPGLTVSGVDTKSCSYFTSNALPLKLVFKNSYPKADPVYAMFKVGDDLRQDMLTMQMVKIMDRLWLKQGLDLKMITFSCLATGPKRGIVELVTESETLRKIQVSYGLTGSFKDRPIKEWLQKHNPTELEYQKAVENFTSSCAGYCVATYVLGICDRHNDNIMLKQSGHMFHIDFNKFLGDAQMFGNFKRDRVPFVLTSDMAFVINNGEKRSDRFQNFIDQCCQAFNILRKNANLFLNLFALMTKAGIPGVSDGAAKYIQRALLPGQTDSQASAEFTRMIEESLKSVFTQFNFFLHNLAQMKWSSHQEGALLSFVPKTYSVNTDGKITQSEVHGYQKRYTPEKHYIFIIKVMRENQKVPTFIFRHFSEFVEFRNKLVDMFPLINWPTLSSRLIGRSHIKTVAETRKQEIEKFLADLWQKAPEVCQSDLVYTFFHPLLRDEQEAQKEKLDLPKLREAPVQLQRKTNQYGQVKLSFQYKKDTLYIMIMHAKDIPSVPEAPSPYVKTYLLPDPEKATKRKTKVIKHSTHPTYNEVIEYKLQLQELKLKTLQVSVWDHDMLMENSFLGAVYIKLKELDLNTDNAQWYQLHNLQITNPTMLA